MTSSRSLIILIIISFVLIGAVSCSNATGILTNTPPILPSELPSPLPSPSETATITTPLQTSFPDLTFDGQLLLQVFYDHPTEIWTTSYPFDLIQPLFKDDEYSLGMAVWSHNGEWIAFSKTALGCPTPSSSIWISRPDGSEARQVTDPIEGKINPNTEDCTGTLLHPAAPLAWSEDDSMLAIRMYGPHILSIETGEIIEVFPKDVLAEAGLDNEYVRDFLGWHSFSPRGNRALLQTIDLDGSPILLWTSLENPDDAIILHPPVDFEYQCFSLANGHTWSPDGHFLISTDKTPDQSRLWIIDVEQDTWEIIATRSRVSEEDERCFVAWSTNGQWVAWWTRVDYSLDNKMFMIDFLDSNTWKTLRETSIATDFRGSMEGWIESSNGTQFLMVWKNQPGGGILLLDPKNSANDRTLIDWDILSGAIERINLLKPGPWQP